MFFVTLYHVLYTAVYVSYPLGSACWWQTHLRHFALCNCENLCCGSCNIAVTWRGLMGKGNKLAKRGWPCHTTQPEKVVHAAAVAAAAAAAAPAQVT